MLFLSHTWRKDDMNRNTHERVAKVKDALVKKGINVWFDEEKMVHDIDACMASGINNANAVVIFITKQYCIKVTNAAKSPNVYDNCYKEFSYATNMKKIIIPVVFEESMRDLDKWPNGIVRMILGSKMLIFSENETPEKTADQIVEMYIRLKRLSDSGRRTAPVFEQMFVKIPDYDDKFVSREVQVSPSLHMHAEKSSKRRYFLSIWCR